MILILAPECKFSHFFLIREKRMDPNFYTPTDTAMPEKHLADQYCGPDLVDELHSDEQAMAKDVEGLDMTEDAPDSKKGQFCLTRWPSHLYTLVPLLFSSVYLTPCSLDPACVLYFWRTVSCEYIHFISLTRWIDLE